MIISINQPGYLPWAGYFDRIAKSDLHVVLDHVQFEKNSFVNRNQILGQAGPFWLTVPVRTKGRFGNLSIANLEIDTSQFWRRKHLESIRSSYSRSPFFGEYWEPLKARIDGDQVLLAELCRSVTGFLLECLHIDVPIHFSSIMRSRNQRVGSCWKSAGTSMRHVISADHSDASILTWMPLRKLELKSNFTITSPSPIRNLCRNSFRVSAL